jgi:peptidoglycan/LPS O-acetylase OafA/YrhL
MKNKIKALLTVHFIAIVAILIIIACCDKKNFVNKLLPGITSIFLVQMAVVYHGNFEKALIVPEWYLSSMIICMLIMVPIFFAFRKLMKGVFVVLILLGVLAIFAVIFILITNMKLKPNMVFDMRAWGEMNLSMFSYYLSLYIEKQTYSNGINILLKIVEIVAYCTPVILGIIPISANNEPICMSITGACAFVAIFITFSKKGNIIKSEKANYIFGYLGSISLPIYIFHPVPEMRLPPTGSMH